MGVFGTGLYSGDFAMDLRTAIAAISRLPFDADKLADIIRESEPQASMDRKDEDYTTFWLVLADQFLKRGLDSSPVKQMALAIIDEGSDLARLAELGMSPVDLRKREKVLQELRARLLEPVTPKTRNVMRKPQEYVMEIGEVFIYPTWQGDSINPYMGREKHWGSRSPDGWGCIVVVDRGRAFEFLTWYRPLTINVALSERPTLESLKDKLLWRLAAPGTCSLNHMKRMEFQKIGRYLIDQKKFRSVFPALSPGVYAATHDISIANELETPPATKRFLDIHKHVPDRVVQYSTIQQIDRIMES